MAVELEIEFDGVAPGLAEHRLSIGTFGEPLEKLLAAARRIASGIATNALGPDYGATGGRFTKEAELLDLQLATLKDGSVKAAFVLVLRLVTGPQTLPLFEDLPERTGHELIESIEAESSGHMRSQVVRKYLGSLRGVSVQRYTLRRDGAQVASVSIGRVELPPEPEDMPYLVASETYVTGVGFEPGRAEVRVKAGQAQQALLATAEQVESALTLRAKPVAILAVTKGKGGRLVSIRPADAPTRALTAEERRRRLFARWDELLARLAR
jgi:hypothetical protein